MATFHVRVKSLTGSVHSISLYNTQDPEQAISLARHDVHRYDPVLFQRISNGRWEAEVVTSTNPAPECPELVDPVGEVRFWVSAVFGLYAFVILLSMDGVEGGLSAVLSFLLQFLHLPTVVYLLVLVVLKEWEKNHA